MPKNKFKNIKNIRIKRIIMGTSVVIIISLCGIVTYKIIKNNDGNTINSIFAAKENSSYSDQTSDQSSDESSEEEISQATLKSIESFLSELGFGYASENVYGFYLNDYDADLSDKDERNLITLPEKLYMWCNDLKEEDRPEYTEQPVLQDYFVSSNLTTTNISEFYAAWIEENKTEEPFDIDKGTLTKEQIKKFVNYEEKIEEYNNYRNTEPKLTDERLDADGEVELDVWGLPRHKYIDDRMVNDITIDNVEDCYEEWVERDKPSTGYPGYLAIINIPQIECFKQYEKDHAEWEEAGNQIKNPNMKEYIADVDSYFQQDVTTIEQSWVENGKDISTHYLELNNQIDTIDHITVTKAQAEKFAEYEEKKEAYEKWAEWKKARNGWLKMKRLQGAFTGKNIEGDTEGSSSIYRQIWAQIARKALNLKEVEKMDTKAYKELYEHLIPQVFDKEGEERNRGNILKKIINGEKVVIYVPGEGKIPENPGGDTPGGTTPGGTTPGGTTPGGTTPGGDTPGGTTPGEDTEPEDKEPAVFKSITLTSPATGIYGEGQKIQIKVSFDKEVYGAENKQKIDQNTAPKLLIRVGEGGENKEMTFESVGGGSIIYNYIAQKEDNGSILLGIGNNFTGTVYNRSGYETELTKLEGEILGNSVKIDNEPPVVKTIECISEQGTYGTGEGEQTEVKIKVTFDEPVYTAKNKVPIIISSAPVFRAYFGSGDIKRFQFDSYSEQDKSITYKYTITEQDKGELKVDINNTFDGTVEIYDAQGNSTKLVKGVVLTGTQIIVNETKPRIDLNKDRLEFDLVDNDRLTETLTANLVGIEEGKTVVWSSDNPDVASVNTEGQVTAKKEGEATISAKIISDDNKVEVEAQCKVIVRDTSKEKVDIQIPDAKNDTISLDLKGTNEIKLDGQTVIVDSEGNVVENTDKKITYISKNDKIVKVENGKLVAVAPGETTIIAKLEDGTEKEFKVKVTSGVQTKIEPTEIVSEVATTTIDPTKTTEFTLKYTLEPPNSNTSTNVMYLSSNEDIATVDDNGKVTIKGEGTVVITMITANGKKAYTTIKAIDPSKNETIGNAPTGDYNTDDRVDGTDLLTMLRHIAASTDNKISKKHQEWIILDERFYLLDVNKDGIVDATDALKLKRHMAASASQAIADKHKDWKLY